MPRAAQRVPGREQSGPVCVAERRGPGARFGRQMMRRHWRRARREEPEATAEDIASGAVEERLAAKLQPQRRGTPTAYVDLVHYLVEHGYLRTAREARLAIVGGKVNVNGEVYAYQHYPKHQLDRDDLGRYRIMVEGVKDPRPAEPSGASA